MCVGVVQVIYRRAEIYLSPAIKDSRQHESQKEPIGSLFFAPKQMETAQWESNSKDVVWWKIRFCQFANVILPPESLFAGPKTKWWPPQIEVMGHMWPFVDAWLIDVVSKKWWGRFGMGRGVVTWARYSNWQFRTKMMRKCVAKCEFVWFEQVTIIAIGHLHAMLDLIKFLFGWN